MDHRPKAVPSVLNKATLVLHSIKTLIKEKLDRAVMLSEILNSVKTLVMVSLSIQANKVVVRLAKEVPFNLQSNIVTQAV